MKALPPGKNSTIRERIVYAMELEGRSRRVGPTEQQAGYSTGHLGRIMKGEREAKDIDRLKVLADVLNVQHAWLILGEGPMRRGGRGPTPAEEAMAFAREAGCREDAWQAAWERNKDREAEMTAMDWALAINAEAMRLDRSGVKRPETVVAEQKSIRRAKKKLEKTDPPEPTPNVAAISVPRPRNAGGL